MASSATVVQKLGVCLHRSEVVYFHQYKEHVITHFVP